MILRRTIYGIVLWMACTVSLTGQDDMAPPLELGIGSRTFFTLNLIDGDGSNFLEMGDPAGRYARVSITPLTSAKSLRIRWTARIEGGAAKFRHLTKHSLEFYPTAMVMGPYPQLSFYIGGRINQVTVVEKWHLNHDFELSTSGGETRFKLPTINKTKIPIDSSIQNIADMTINKWSPHGHGEELWLFEWESRNVYAMNPKTKLKEIRVPATQVGAYRSLNMSHHSIYGAVCLFQQKPWASSRSDWNRENDADPLVIYDADLNGVIDGSFPFPYDGADEHPLFTTGEFLDY